jgi:alkylhydroperoxidase family enzyme
MLVWNPEGADDRVWAMLRTQLTDPEIVELGSFIAVTYGQQRVIDAGLGLARTRSEGS